MSINFTICPICKERAIKVSQLPRKNCVCRKGHSWHVCKADGKLVIGFPSDESQLTEECTCKPFKVKMNVDIKNIFTGPSHKLPDRKVYQADLILLLRTTLVRHGMKLPQFATLIKRTESETKQILHGDMTKATTDDLLEWLGWLGYQTKIVVGPAIPIECSVAIEDLITTT